MNTPRGSIELTHSKSPVSPYPQDLLDDELSLEVEGNNPSMGPFLRQQGASIVMILSLLCVFVTFTLLKRFNGRNEIGVGMRMPGRL
jgi:hypothetical protein